LDSKWSGRRKKEGIEDEASGGYWLHPPHHLCPDRHRPVHILALRPMASTEWAVWFTRQPCCFLRAIYVKL